MTPEEASRLRKLRRAALAEAEKYLKRAEEFPGGWVTSKALVIRTGDSPSAASLRVQAAIYKRIALDYEGKLMAAGEPFQ